MKRVAGEPEFLRTGLPCYDYQTRSPAPGVHPAGGDGTMDPKSAYIMGLLSIAPALLAGLKVLLGVEWPEMVLILYLAWRCALITLVGNGAHRFAGVILLAVVLLAAGLEHDVQEHLQMGWIPYWIGIIFFLAINYASLGIGAAVGNAVEDAVDEGYGRR